MSYLYASGIAMAPQGGAFVNASEPKAAVIPVYHAILAVADSLGARVTHEMHLLVPGDVDAFVSRWLRRAYELDA